MKQIAIIGSSSCSDLVYGDAFKIGIIISNKRYALISRGRGGIMEVSYKGGKFADVLYICVLPSTDKKDSNTYCDIIISTGIGEMIDSIGAGIIISIDRNYSALSELATVLKENKKILLYKPSNLIDGFVSKLPVLNKIIDVGKLI